MPNAASIACLEHRLVALGCPLEEVRRQVQELADHHEDLKLAALAEGCSDAEAEARADQQMGKPAELAEHLALVWRRTSWWGRHPIIGFCVFPILAYFLAWAILEASLIAFVYTAIWLLYGESFTVTDLASAVTSDPDGFTPYFSVVNGISYVAVAIAAIGFGRIACRAGVGLKWMVAACAVVSFQGFFNRNELASHHISVGYGWPPNWGCAVIPLVVASGMWAIDRRRRFLSGVAIEAPAVPAVESAPCPTPVFPGWNFLSPTSVTVVLAMLALAAIVDWAIADRMAQRARLTELKTKVWPTERAAAVARMRARQSTDTMYETLIPLRPFVNMALTDSIGRSREIVENDLSSLPTGIHVFGGVPFEVIGRVQLMGRGFPAESRVYPSKARNIPIQSRCRRIHLLHGACFLDAGSVNSRTPVGAIVLHYADGSRMELPVIAGAHVLDWWGPVFRTGVEPAQLAIVANTELAWAGMNPAIQLKQTEDSIRLYRTTFENPRPEAIVASVDYVSKLTDAAPFMVGMTVE